MFLWLMPAGVWWLVATSSIAQSIEWTIKGQAMVLRTSVYQNNIFVIRQQSPALWEKLGPYAYGYSRWVLRHEGCKAGRQKSCGTGFFLNLITWLLLGVYWLWNLRNPRYYSNKNLGKNFALMPDQYSNSPMMTFGECRGQIREVGAAKSSHSIQTFLRSKPLPKY